MQNANLVTRAVLALAALGPIAACSDAGDFDAEVPSASAEAVTAFTVISGGSYDAMSGVSSSGGVVGSLDDGDWIEYKNIDFGVGANELIASIGVPGAYAGQKLVFTLDSLTGTTIGTLTVAATGGWNTFTQQTASISTVTGVHNLFIKVSGAYGAGNIQSLAFNGSSSGGGTTTPSYTLSISSPTQNANVTGTTQVVGSAPGFLNVEIYDPLGTRLAQVTPSSTGAFTASVDTTKLYNGSQTLTIDAWDSPPGQTFNHTAEAKLTLNVSGGLSSSSGGSSPYGGPSGYSILKVNDSFGSSKAGANITSVSQFNPGTAYGENGSGWDDHMCAWDCSKANLSMASDHLEIRPTGGGSGFISSHFEYLPSGSHKVYWEIRATTGRGDYVGGQSWPAFWLFAGNEPGSNNAQSEFDLMETYMTQQWGPYDSAAGGYAQHFVVTTHPNANSTGESFSIDTPGIDITSTYNVYGCEVSRGSDGNLYFDVYFNGKYIKSTSVGLPWNSSAPSMFLGWNPGSSSYSLNVMKVDYVKAWVK